MPKLTEKKEVKKVDGLGVIRDAVELTFTYGGGLFHSPEELKVVVDKDVYDEGMKEYNSRNQKVIGDWWPNSYSDVKGDDGNKHEIQWDRWGGIEKINGKWVEYKLKK